MRRMFFVLLMTSLVLTGFAPAIDARTEPTSTTYTAKGKRAAPRETAAEKKADPAKREHEERRTQKRSLIAALLLLMRGDTR